MAFPKVPDLYGRTEIDFLKCQGTEVQTGFKSKLYTSGLKEKIPILIEMSLYWCVTHSDYFSIGYSKNSE